MDDRTGRIYPAAAMAAMLAAMPKAERSHFKPMQLDPTPFQRATGKVGRNDPCPCASGKKFKNCCLWRANNPE